MSSPIRLPLLPMILLLLATPALANPPAALQGANDSTAPEITAAEVAAGYAGRIESARPGQDLSDTWLAEFASPDSSRRDMIWMMIGDAATNGFGFTVALPPGLVEGDALTLQWIYFPPGSNVTIEMQPGVDLEPTSFRVRSPMPFDQWIDEILLPDLEALPPDLLALAVPGIQCFDVVMPNVGQVTTCLWEMRGVRRLTQHLGGLTILDTGWIAPAPAARVGTAIANAIRFWQDEGIPAIRDMAGQDDRLNGVLDQIGGMFGD